MRTLRISLHLNLSLTYLRATDYQEAIKSATLALSLNPDPLDQGKAYTRRGKAHTASRNDKLAVDDFKKALEVLPPEQSDAAKVDLDAAKTRIQLRREKERKAYAQMFQ
jgi:tetratricopeptide (TPR) repeat protein